MPETEAATVSELIAELQAKMRASIIDLRFRDGRWAVMVPHGTMMTCVPNSHSDSPEESLRLALDRWELRSPERPYLHMPEDKYPVNV